MATAYHLVHYRHFENNAGQPSLEHLIRAAFNTKNSTSSDPLWLRIDDRNYTLPDDKDKRSLLINRASDLTSAVFGELCLMQENDLQSILKLKANVLKISNITTVSVYDIEDREAPQGSQFIRGMAYWMVVKNHVFFVKTHSMSAELLSAYIEWLLKTQSKVVNQNFALLLQAEVDKSAVSGDLGDIRSLRVKTSSGSNVKMTIDEQEPVQTEKGYTKTVGERSIAQNGAFNLFKSLFGEKEAESLADSLGPKEQLVAETSFRIKGSRTSESKQKMKEIVNIAADSDLAEVKVEGKDFKMSQGDAILRTNMPFELPYPNSNLLDFDNVADQLQKVFTRFVEDRKITP